MDLQKVRIVWRRTGKEHGEDSFQVNPPEVVEKPILSKIEQINNTQDPEHLDALVQQLNQALAPQPYLTQPFEAHPLDDLAVANIEAGDDAFR